MSVSHTHPILQLALSLDKLASDVGALVFVDQPLLDQPPSEHFLGGLDGIAPLIGVNRCNDKTRRIVDEQAVVAEPEQSVDVGARTRVVAVEQ